MKPQVDALMRDYTGDVPGASVLVLRDGEPIVRASYGLADVEAHVPATRDDQLSPRIREQAVHRRVDPAARRGRPAAARRSRAQWLPSLPKAAERVTIRHLLTHTSGLIDYEDVIPETLQAAAARCRCAALAGIAGPHVLRAGQRLSLQQQRLCAARADRRAGVRQDVRDVPARAHLPAARHEQHGRLRGRNLDRRATAPSAIRRNKGAGAAPIRARPAPYSATAASTPRSTTWRNGMPRSTTVAC